MRLKNLASLVRSKNAGPFELTFDIMFPNEETYQRVRSAGVIRPDYFAGLFGIAVSDVRIYEYDPAHAFKVTVPRPIASGSPGDGDVYGCQQFGPLAELEIPWGSSA